MFSRIGTVEFTHLLLWPGLGKSKTEQAMALATADIFPRLHRPGSVLAGAWAAMQYMGHKYVFSCDFMYHSVTEKFYLRLR